MRLSSEEERKGYYANEILPPNDQVSLTRFARGGKLEILLGKLVKPYVDAAASIDRRSELFVIVKAALPGRKCNNSLIVHNFHKSIFQ